MAVHGCPARIHRLDRLSSSSVPFRFLHLPPEVRDQIVSYLIVSHEPVIIHQPRFNRHPSPPTRPHSSVRFNRPLPSALPSSSSKSLDDEEARLGHTRLALISTCRLLYHDHWKTYYAANMFSVNLDTFIRFSKEIPAHCRSEIRRIAFRMPNICHHPRIWKMLASLKKLEELEIWLHKASTTEESERELCASGVRECRRLRSFSLRREGCGGAGVEYAEINERDRQVERRINAHLRCRKGYK